jgi:hypothetical protein
MRAAQDLEAFLIDFGSKEQGMIVVADSESEESELSIDFFFCTDRSIVFYCPRVGSSILSLGIFSIFPVPVNFSIEWISLSTSYALQRY